MDLTGLEWVEVEEHVGKWTEASLFVNKLTAESGWRKYE